MSGYSRAVTASPLEYELRNVGVVKARRGELSFDEAAELLRDAVLPPTRDFDVGGAFELAQHRGLTFYDAGYPRLAMELDVPLLTVDSELLRVEPHRCVDPSAPEDA